MKESLVKTLLHHIFGILAIVRYPLRHGKHSPFVTKNQFLEGERLPTLCSGHQRSVGVFGHTTRTKGFHSPVPPRHLLEQRTTRKEAIGAPQAAGDNNGSKWLTEWGISQFTCILAARIVTRICQDVDRLSIWLD